MSFFVKFLK